MTRTRSRHLEGGCRSFHARLALSSTAQRRSDVYRSYARYGNGHCRTKGIDIDLKTPAKCRKQGARVFRYTKSWLSRFVLVSAESHIGIAHAIVGILSL